MLLLIFGCSNLCWCHIRREWLYHTTRKILTKPTRGSMSSGRYVSALIIELTNLIKTNKTANAIRYGKAIKLKTKVTDKPRVDWVCL